MALTPEIQAAIAKNLSQITDLNALQDALKILDPNGQVQAQQQEEQPSAEQPQEEPQQVDTPAESTSQEEQPAESEQTATDNVEQTSKEQTQEPEASAESEQQSEETTSGQEAAPEEAATEQESEATTGQEPEAEQVSEEQPTKQQDKKPRQKSNAIDYSKASLKKLKDAWNQSKVLRGVKLDANMLQYGLRFLQSQLTNLLKNTPEENEEIIVEDNRHRNRKDPEGKEKIISIIKKSFIPQCKELIRKKDITTVQNILNLVTAINNKYEQDPEKTTIKLTTNQPGFLKRAGSAIKGAGKKIVDTAKSLKNRWQENQILRHVNSGTVSADDLEKALSLAKTNKHKFGDSKEIDGAVIEFQAALARNDYALLESTMQLVKELKEYQLLEKDQTYAFLKDYFAQIDEDYQGLLDSK